MHYPEISILLHYFIQYCTICSQIQNNPNQPFTFFAQKSYAGAYVAILLASMTGFSLATYHFGIENNYWQNFSGCSDRLSSIELNATNLLEDINKIEPNCSDPLKFFGLSLSGYNIISNTLIAGLLIFDLINNKKNYI